MSTRYSKLFALSENLYCEGSPVIIAAGALHKDNQTGGVLAQLKIRNIQNKPIKAVTVKITPFDTAGRSLGEAISYQYLDLSAKRDADFGQKTAIVLPNNATRSFTVSVSEVVFADNNIWTNSDETWESLLRQKLLKEALEPELVKQYQIKYGRSHEYVFEHEKDLWCCSCGVINHTGEDKCHSCYISEETLSAFNVDDLQTECNTRLEAERKKAEAEAEAQRATAAEAAKKAEEQAAAAKERARKAKKTALIAAPILVVVIAASVLTFNFVKTQKEEATRLNAYNAAVALADEGEYDTAIAAFTELGDYKDSAEMALETRYNMALSLVESRNFDAAITAFTELGDYKDSAEQISETKYKKAVSFFESGGNTVAIIIFEELGDYKDSAEKINQINDVKYLDAYNTALEYYQSGEPISLYQAWNYFIQCPSEYRDTQLYKAKLEDAASQINGKYVKSDIDGSKMEIKIDVDFLTIKPNSDLVDSRNINCSAEWILEDGQAVCGYASSGSDIMCTITLVDGGIYVESNVNDNFTGTYIKEK